MRILWLLLLGLTMTTACNRSEQEAIESKCDASLRHRAEELAHSNTNGTVEVMGRAGIPLLDAHRKHLEDAGAKISQMRQDMFVARIPVKKLGHVANLDFVKSLQLSQTREPLGH